MEPVDRYLDAVSASRTKYYEDIDALWAQYDQAKLERSWGQRFWDNIGFSDSLMGDSWWKARADAKRRMDERWSEAWRAYRAELGLSTDPLPQVPWY